MASDDLGLAHPSAQAVEGDEAMVERVARVLAPPAWAVAGTRHDRPWLAASRRFSIRNAKAAIEVMRPALSADAAATIAATRKQAAEDKARLDWLEANSNVDIAYEGWEDDVWQVHTVNGGRSNREWTLRGEGVTVRQAIDTAIETLRLRAEDQQKAAATPTIADPDGEARDA